MEEGGRQWNLNLARFVGERHIWKQIIVHLSTGKRQKWHMFDVKSATHEADALNCEISEKLPTVQPQTSQQLTHGTKELKPYNHIANAGKKVLSVSTKR